MVNTIFKVKKNYRLEFRALTHGHSNFFNLQVEWTLPLVTCMAATTGSSIKGPTAELTQLLEVFT